jgi:ubiquinol-cytochrome c reductase cytochrome b subunit
MVTPTQIVPEWYFLTLYAILRSVPSKLGGLVVLIIVFLFLMFIPYIIGVFQVVKNSVFKPFNRMIIPLFFLNLIILGWIGGQAVEPLYLFLGQLCIVVYFLLFILLFICNLIEFYVLSISNVYKKK